MKILLLEDDIMLNEAITQYLSSVGHSIISVKDGKECKKLLLLKLNLHYDSFEQ